MERLTIRNNDGSYSQPTHTTFEKMFYRLAEFEDFMEKNGFQSIEDLDHKIKSWINETQAKELAEETIKNYLESIEFQKQINDLTMYKVMWQKFKEWLNKDITNGEYYFKVMSKLEQLEKE